MGKWQKNYDAAVYEFDKDVADAVDKAMKCEYLSFNDIIGVLEFEKMMAFHRMNEDVAATYVNGAIGDILKGMGKC